MSESISNEEFQRQFQGSLFEPGDPAYDENRQVWNGMIDRRPSLIARCSNTDDVVAAVNYARSRKLTVAVRGGGHNVAGNAICDEGVVIDLRGMKAVTVDPERQIASAQGGVTWGEYDRETQKHGLASTGGAISTTGIAGLTLGGGFGWLARSYGLACDHLVEAEVVTAAGDVVTANADNNADLFWGLRGGGGNFGVVTRFNFRLHPVGELLAGLVLYPRDEASGLMEIYARLTADAPDGLGTMAAFLSSPEGDPVVGVYSVYNGPRPDGEKVLTPLREFSTPILDDVDSKPYTLVQQAFDEGFPAGNRNYWKSCFLKTLTRDCLETVIDHANRAPTPLCVAAVEHLMGGAVARVPADATAFANRDVEFNLLILGASTDPGSDDAVRSWVRSFYQAMEPFSSGQVYVNYMDMDEADRITEAYDQAHYTRLSELKKKFDIDNLFRTNQNISPGA